MNSRTIRALLLLLVACPASAAPPDATHVITISGRFVDPGTGRGIPHARVMLEKRNYSFFGNLSRAGMDALPTLLGKTVTDRKGTFRFVTSSSGLFEITCSSGATRWYGVTQVRRAQSTSIDIPAVRLPQPRSFEPPHGRRPRAKT